MTERKKPYEVALMPWLRMEKAVESGPIRFVPFVRGEEPFGHGTDQQAWVDAIFQMYRDILGESREDGVLVEVNGNIFLDEVDRTTRDLIDCHIHTLAFASFACNQYFTKWKRTINTSIFELTLQRFTVPPVFVSFLMKGRVDTLDSDGGYTFEEVSIVEPLAARCVGDVSTDEALLASLVAAIEDSFLNGRLLESIINFNRAYSYRQGLTEQEQIVSAVSAYERLLNESRRDNLVKKYLRNFKPTSEILLSANTKFACSSEDADCSVREHWMRDLWELRCDYGHGAVKSMKKLSWQVQEHLVLAAFAFPLLVKSILANGKRFTLTLEDEAAINAFERLAIDGMPPLKPVHSRETSKEPPWNEILLKEETRLEHERTAAKVERLVTEWKARAHDKGESARSE